MQGDCSVSQSRGGNAGDPDINCHRLHVEALSGHAVSVSAEELIAPGCAIAADNIDLEIWIAERGSQIVQQVEHPRIICANIPGTVIPQIMVEPLKRFLIVSPAIAVDDVPCPPQDDRRRVYMYFQYRNGWQCQFLEQNLKTPLPRKLHFMSSEKVIELVTRGGGITDRESRLTLDQAIAKGRGGIFLSLTAEQYADGQNNPV